MLDGQAIIRDVNKDSGFKAKDRNKDSGFKARTKDCNFVLMDNQGPGTKVKDNIPGSLWTTKDQGPRSRTTSLAIILLLLQISCRVCLTKITVMVVI